MNMVAATFSKNVFNRENKISQTTKAYDFVIQNNFF